MDAEHQTPAVGHDADTPAKLSVADAFDLHPRRPYPTRLSSKSVIVVLGALMLAITFVVLLGLRVGNGRDGQALSGASTQSLTRPSERVIDENNPAPAWARNYEFMQNNGVSPTPSDAAAATDTPSVLVELPKPTEEPQTSELLEEVLASMRDGFDSSISFSEASTKRTYPTAAEFSLEPDEQLARRPVQGGLPLTAGAGSRVGDLLFLRSTGRQPDRVSGKLSTPHSPYELRAGSVIPAALVTAVHSDLPGDLVAQVIQDVYDAETGEHLLIPQGSRLLGTYRNEIAAGQDRVLVVWQRLMLPNGKSIGLDAMPGVDQSGAAGLHDQVDYHLKQVVGATALSSVIALTGNLARGQGERGEPLSVVGETVAQQSARFGQQIVDRQLNRPPTITIRAGSRFNVLVNRDIPLELYDGVRSPH